LEEIAICEIIGRGDDLRREKKKEERGVPSKAIMFARSILSLDSSMPSLSFDISLFKTPIYKNSIIPNYWKR